MTAFGHVCSICEVKQGPALSVKIKKRLHPYHICVSKVSTVTGIRRVAVAILVTVMDFELSHLCGCVKSVNSHRDQAGRGRHPRNCHGF